MQNIFFIKILISYGIGYAFSMFTNFYLMSAYIYHNEPPNVPMHIIMFLVPMLYGITLLFALLVEFEYMFIIGALFGLAMSLLGRFGFELPKRLFLMKPSEEYQVHIIAPVLYGTFFQLLIKPLTTVLVPS